LNCQEGFLMEKKIVPPRPVPDRDSKYMGLAWIHAGFSKDPNTQVGAQIVSAYNQPLGSGYNGPPRLIDDDTLDWGRSIKKADVSRYDVIVHAEINAIDHTGCADLTGATLYVTALPCPSCMLEIIRKEIERVLYFDFQGDANSSLQNASWCEKSLKMARMANIQIEKFTGNINWVADWSQHLKELGIF